jgi:hypothetical protein
MQLLWGFPFGGIAVAIPQMCLSPGTTWCSIFFARRIDAFQSW